MCATTAGVGGDGGRGETGSSGDEVGGALGAAATGWWIAERILGLSYALGTWTWLLGTFGGALGISAFAIQAV